ncbi:SGNH/GDSL hydrolase family protein [Leifsonia sp. LS-T14]|uniref:SGNH/GDSL hydrolase family protein n=1 Tax=unclassified Leifsonia TaxID=2663824 RepID=UPI0035A58C3A
MTTRRSARGPFATVLLAATALAVVLTGCTPAGPAVFTPDATASPSPTAAPRAPLTAAAIGDSIAIGNGVPADDAWPLLVADHFGWTLSDFAESAAGFTAPGLNTHIFNDQVSAVIRLHPDVVIVGATRNDVFAPTATLDTAATAAMQRLRTALPHARIIGVSALWGSDPTPDQIPVISATVKEAVLGVGGSWVDLGQPFTGHPELVLADHVHPTVEGQELLAQKVITAVQSQLFTS